MTNRRAAQIDAVLIALMIIASFWAWLQPPAEAVGNAGPWPSSPGGLFIMPAMAAAGWLYTVLLPHIDPRGDNLRRSGQAYGTTLIAGTVWFGLFHGFIVAHALGFKIDEFDAMGIFIDVFGALLIILGNVFGKLRWNYTLGIRTPWTLADERVWDKTHRFAGWLFVINGFIVLASALTPLNVIVRFGIMFVLLAVTMVLTVGKSYLLWREQRQAPHGGTQ